MTSRITPHEAIQQMEAVLAMNKTGANDLSFQEAAAVLIHFDPEALNAYTSASDNVVKGWSNFFSFSDPVKKSGPGSRWQLRASVRREALRRLATRENMLAALAVNPGHSDDTRQQLFEKILRDENINLENLRREDLVACSMIVEWLNNILPVTTLKSQIERAIPMADLLTPMHRLAGSDFVGRKKELNALSEYVGIAQDNSLLNSAGRFILNFFTDLSKNPPLLIYGPGGVGKSTLIGRFVLDNVERTASPLLFAYLDTDKAVIDPKQPKTYMMDAARQLAAQMPEQKERLLMLKEDIGYSLQSFDEEESSKSFYEGDHYTRAFGRLISLANKPVLLVVDTFEEAQYLGVDVVHGVWTLFADLQKAAPNLRIIVMGRALINSFPVKQLQLTELSRNEAIQLVSNGLKKDFPNASELTKITEEIIDIAGLNPMSLRLALLIVQEPGGVENLRKVETKTWYMRRVRSELVQARFYGRILTHIRDENIKKLAYPGLIVRRITKGVITEVLAEPCQLTFEHPSRVDELLDLLANEASLIDRDPDDGALCHRQDVRRVMLKDLLNEVSPEIKKKIHDNAIRYYSKFDTIIGRSEEIYHRLWREDDVKEIEKRWMPGLENRLRNALEELPVKSLVWLANKLNITPDKDLLKDADKENWEGIAATAAERYLQTGRPELALETLRERTYRSASSPLYRLELEALRYLGLYEEASFVVGEILDTITKSADRSVLCEINIQAALIKEAQDLFDDAIAYIQNAEKIMQMGQRKSSFRVLITHIRLLRKKGDSDDDNRQIFTEQALKYLLNPKDIDAFISNPALFREIVAELGKVKPSLLQNAIEWIGVEIRNEEQAALLAKAFEEWNLETLWLRNQKTGLGELAELAFGASRVDWMRFVQENAGRRLNNTIQHWRKEVPGLLEPSPSGKKISKFDKALVDLYRKNVDLSIKRTLIEDKL